MLIGEFAYDGEELAIYAVRQRGQLAVYVEDAYGDRVVDMSVRAPHLQLEWDEFVLNAALRREMVRSILSTGYFEDTGRRVRHGEVIGQPVWRLAGVAARLPIEHEHDRFRGVKRTLANHGRRTGRRTW